MTNNTITPAGGAEKKPYQQSERGKKLEKARKDAGLTLEGVAERTAWINDGNIPRRGGRWVRGLERDVDGRVDQIFYGRIYAIIDAPPAGASQGEFLLAWERVKTKRWREHYDNGARRLACLVWNHAAEPTFIDHALFHWLQGAEDEVLDDVTGKPYTGALKYQVRTALGVLTDELRKYFPARPLMDIPAPPMVSRRLRRADSWGATTRSLRKGSGARDGCRSCAD